MSHDETSASAVKSLRVKALLDEVPKTEIARKTGMNRATVRKYLKGDDIKLSAFVQLARAIGADPVEVLADAISKNQPTVETTQAA